MKAVIIQKPGGPEVLEYTEKPVPIPGLGEVLIRVAYAGINRPDIAQRKGRYPAPPGAPQDIPGLEVSGIIESVGSECWRFKVGDAVCALLSGGGYAEFVATPESQCMEIPKGLSLEQAAALPETGLTVWHNVFQRGQLAKEETLLIHGGTSGIGVMAIQMAVTSGARVITTAGSEEKCKRCIELGASLAIHYKEEDFVKSVLNFTDQKGVDVILDMVGGDYTQKNLDCLATEGRLVLINFMGGENAEIKLSSILRKRLTITGSTLRARENSFKASLVNEVEKIVWPWITAGKIKPVIDSVHPLNEASDAHKRIESGEHIGKLLLKVC